MVAKLEKKKIKYINRFNLIYVDGYWSHAENRKVFFDRFAKENKFDSGLPHNWYKITREELIRKSKVCDFIHIYFISIF
jgi:hypothetical protein